MLAEAHYSELFAGAALPKHELLEIRRSKISLLCAKKVTAIQQFGCLVYLPCLQVCPLRYIRQCTKER